MIPDGADLFNHGQRKCVNVVYSFDNKCDCWSFVTTQFVAKGEELLISYGCKPRISFLRQYGFVPPLLDDDEFRCSQVLLDNKFYIRYADSDIIEFVARASDSGDEWERINIWSRLDTLEAARKILAREISKYESVTKFFSGDGLHNPVVALRLFSLAFLKHCKVKILSRIAELIKEVREL
jgi:hypothetical protein